MIKEKADILFLIIGGNPFPNLISAATRIKREGKIICVCTEDTGGKSYDRFRKLVKKKMDNVMIEKLMINELNKKDIGEKIQSKLTALGNSIIGENKISLLELNYTGGTKLISTTACLVIKGFNYEKYNKKVNINLTYIDSERESLCFEFREGTKGDYIPGYISLFKLDSNFDLNIDDILSTYGDEKNTRVTSKEKSKPKFEEIANRLGNLFCNIDKEQYNDWIKFFSEKIRKEMRKLGKDQYKKYLIKIFSDYNIFSDEEILLLSELEEGKLYAYFYETKWLEEYILNILIELEEEGIIEDVRIKVERIKADGEQGEFEVDLVAYRKYKLFAISVTFINEADNAKGKLYEIKQRAINLAGDEAGVCYINLCWEIEKLKTNYRDIWNNEKLESALVLGVQDFSDLKDKLRGWLKGGG